MKFFFQMLQTKCSIDDSMIRGIAQKNPTKLGVYVMPQHDSDPSQIISDLRTTAAQHIAGQTIKRTKELSSLKVNVTVPFFEIIEFFKNGYREGKVMLFESTNAARVVQTNIGIQNE